MSDNSKILLVEDDQFISEVYSRKLIDAGFDLRVAFDGHEALEVFDSFKPDLVLLDIMLPKMDGWGVLREIKKDKQFKTKVFMLTNLGEKEDINKSFDLGADDFLIKSSLTPSELVELVRNKI